MSSTATHPPVTVPSRSGVLTAVGRSLRSDLIRVTTLQSNTALLGLTIGTGLAVIWAAARYIDAPMTVASLSTFFAVFTAVFAGDTSSVAATTVASITFTTLAALLGIGVGLAARHSTAASPGCWSGGWLKAPPCRLPTPASH